MQYGDAERVRCIVVVPSDGGNPIKIGSTDEDPYWFKSMHEGIKRVIKDHKRKNWSTRDNAGGLKSDIDCGGTV